MKEGGFEGGIRSAITGLLASPFFLYRGEHVPAGLRPGDTYAISDLELASKLSFFLWNTIPDDELLQLGIDGKLSEPAVLDQQVQRMLADPRSMTLASNFVHQWLDMKRLDEIVPDSAVFPYASGRSDPREDFRTELTLFADSIFREDRSVVDLLTREPHVSQRAPRAALRHHRREGRSLPAGRAQAVGALGAARQGRRADGGGVSEPHVAGAARRVHPQTHSGRAAGDAAAERPDAGREGHRHDEGADGARDDREASRRTRRARPVTR